MEPDTAKTLGGVGSIFVVVSPIFMGMVLGIVGYILVLLGLRGFGDYYNDEGIKRNSLRWFIWGIIGLIATIVVFIFAAKLIFDALWDSAIGYSTILAGVIATVIITLIVAEIFYVISAIYLKRAYAALAAKSGEGLFNTAAKLYWWGSLFIVVFVGLIIIWISWILSAAAFFAMKLQRPDAATQAAPPPPG